MKIHAGDLIAKPGMTYEFEEITGSVDVRGTDTRTAFLKLTTVGGYVDANGADTRTAFPKLTTVGGSVYANGADTRTAFPKLTTVGGYVSARDADTKTAFPKLRKQNAGQDALTICHKAMTTALALVGLVSHDGILSKFISAKSGVYRVKIIGKTKVSYVVVRDNVTAHGATLSEARADLLFKLGKRDTSIYKKWTLKTEKPIEEMIAAYRAITGACGHGVSNFLNGKDYRKKVSVEFAIAETQGQFGNDVFSEFFAGDKK